MSNSGKLELTSLDFDAIKSSLKTYLASQTQFQDYDFEGAGINILLDVLAHNTHLNAFYLNMVANETFLDTAVLRQSVVSHAKSLGYTPRSAVASMATVNVAITKSNTDPTSILTLPRFTQFASDSLDGVSYNFVTLDDYNASVSGNVFSFTGVTLKEGAPAIKTFFVSKEDNQALLYDLVDQNIDTSTIQVIVQKSLTNIKQTKFNLATDSVDTSSDSNVFFVQEGQNGNYQIYFGDGVIGTQLDDGNVIIVSYIVTNGDTANGLKNFKLQTNVLSGSTSNVTTVLNSAGGSPAEDITSIKFNAPKSYIAQNRAITKNDYVTLINKKYPYFDAVTIWGGEEETPPVYGKIFISAKPKNGFVVTEFQKNFVINEIIKPMSILTVTPEFVDVDYNYLILETSVEYDSTKTSKNQTEISNTVKAAIYNHANLNFNTFNSEFRMSRLLRSIDDSDPSILSCDSDVYFEKRFTPDITTSKTYTLEIGVPLHHGGPEEKLVSYPAFSINDDGGVSRQAFIEETPDSFSGFDGIDIVTTGSGYTSAPTLTIVGDGIGANAYARIVNGKIQSVIIDNKGSEYTTATITATGGGGTGATFRPVLQGKVGTLRTYYYDTNNNKIILNDNAGSVDYITGTLTLTNFSPTSVSDPFNVLRIRIKPNTFSFGSTKQRIITLDNNDPNNIELTVTNINNK